METRMHKLCHNSVTTDSATPRHERGENSSCKLRKATATKNEIKQQLREREEKRGKGMGVDCPIAPQPIYFHALT